MVRNIRNIHNIDTWYSVTHFVCQPDETRHLYAMENKHCKCLLKVRLSVVLLKDFDREH